MREKMLDSTAVDYGYYADARPVGMYPGGHASPPTLAVVREFSKTMDCFQSMDGLLRTHGLLPIHGLLQVYGIPNLWIAPKLWDAPNLWAAPHQYCS